MSSSEDDVPEEVGLSVGKEAFDAQKQVEEEHLGQARKLAETEKAAKKKRRQEVASQERAKHETKKARLKKIEDAAAAANADAEEGEDTLDLLPQAVVSTVLKHVGKQEKADEKPTLEHGRVVELQIKPKVVELEKGPVSVKVLGVEEEIKPREKAIAFRDKMLRRHRRSRSMLS